METCPPTTRVIIMASGARAEIARSALANRPFSITRVEEISAALARELVRDGERRDQLVTVEVRGARSAADAERAARKIANSPLVKTAFLRMRSNVGRILMGGRIPLQAGYVESDRLVLWIGGVKVAANGRLLVEALGEAGTKMRERELCGGSSICGSANRARRSLPAISATTTCESTRSTQPDARR